MVTSQQEQVVDTYPFILLLLSLSPTYGQNMSQLGVRHVDMFPCERKQQIVAIADRCGHIYVLKNSNLSLYCRVQLKFPLLYFLFSLLQLFYFLIHCISQESQERAASFRIFTLRTKQRLNYKKCIGRISHIFFTTRCP